MIKTYGAIVVLVLGFTLLPSPAPVGVMAATAAGQALACPYPAALQDELDRAWDEFRPQLIQRLRGNLSHDRPVGTQRNILALYRTFYELIGFVRKSGACADATSPNRDFRNLDELAAMLAIPFESQYLTLAFDSQGQSYTGWICDAAYGGGAQQSNPVAQPQRDVRGPQESMLNSANYLYLVCAALHAISKLSPADRTPAMNRLAAQTPFIRETYQRWLTDSSNLLEINRRARLNDPQHRHGGRAWGLETAVSPAVAGGIAELIQAQGAQAVSSEMRDMAELWVQLLNDYAQPLGQGRYTFNAGLGADETYNKAASFSGAALPAQAKSLPPAVKDLSYDLSHFRIWLIVLETYSSYEQQVGIPGGNNDSILRGLAKQFRQKVWNGDTAKPRFTNYFSGTTMNGWYAARYDAQGRTVAGTGTAPFGLGAVAPWYFRLGLWDADVIAIQSAYYDASDGFAGLTAEERLRYISNFVALPTT